MSWSIQKQNVRLGSLVKKSMGLCKIILLKIWGTVILVGERVLRQDRTLTLCVAQGNHFAGMTHEM